MGENPSESVTVKLLCEDKSDYPVAIPWLLPKPGVDDKSFGDIALSAVECRERFLLYSVREEYRLKGNIAE